MAALVVRILKASYPPIPSQAGYSAHVRSALMCTLAKSTSKRIDARKLLQKLEDIHRRAPGSQPQEPAPAKVAHAKARQSPPKVPHPKASQPQHDAAEALLRDRWQERHQKDKQRKQLKRDRKRRQHAKKKAHEAAHQQAGLPSEASHRRQVPPRREDIGRQQQEPTDSRPVEHATSSESEDEEVAIQRRRRERVAFVEAMLQVRVRYFSKCFSCDCQVMYFYVCMP